MVSVELCLWHQSWVTALQFSSNPLTSFQLPFTQWLIRPAIVMLFINVKGWPPSQCPTDAGLPRVTNTGEMQWGRSFSDGCQGFSNLLSCRAHCNSLLLQIENKELVWLIFWGKLSKNLEKNLKIIGIKIQDSPKLLF